MEVISQTYITLLMLLTQKNTAFYFFNVFLCPILHCASAGTNQQI